MRIEIEERTLHFKQPAGTSRGVYTERRIWLVTVTDGSAVGIGECAPLPKLSCDDIPNYAEVLRHFCDEVERTGEIPYEALRDYPSMLFGLETALYEVRRKKEEGRDVLFDTPFSRGEVGIPINGLVWMGTFDEMRERIEQKLEQGFRCVKLKIGAIDFDAKSGEENVFDGSGNYTLTVNATGYTAPYSFEIKPEAEPASDPASTTASGSKSSGSTSSKSNSTTSASTSSS